MKNLMYIILSWMLVFNTTSVLFAQDFINLTEMVSTSEKLMDETKIIDGKLGALSLSRSIRSLQDPEVDLKLIFQNESQLGKHYTYQQKYKGYPIWGAQIRVHVRPNGKVFLNQSTLVTVDFNIPERPHWANQLALTSSGLKWAKFEIIEVDGKEYEQLSTPNEILMRREGSLHYQVKDTTVYGYVFLANPVNSAMTSYGGAYVDSNDADTKVLRDELKLVSFQAAVINDTFRLQNEWLILGHVNAPRTEEAYSLNDSFLFNRSQNGFEDVNAYYHITKMADHVTTLGFDSLIIDKLILDAHASFGADNSSFNYTVDPQELEFGTGNVDDAEDGEVVVHEFAHSLSFIGSGITFSGNERRSMEEGTADYLSVSYSRQYGDHNWENVFSWDGHNEFWNGFNASSSKNYKTDLRGISNEDREIWSSALTCIYEKLGRNTTDSLVLNYLYLQANNTKMPQMANAMLTIDSLLWDEKHYADIKGCFAWYGILDWGVGIDEKDELTKSQNIQILNSFQWMNGSSSLVIKSQEYSITKIEISNSIGQTVFSADTDIYQFELPADIVSSGTYFLRVSTADHRTITQKLIRL